MKTEPDLILEERRLRRVSKDEAIAIS